MKYTEMYIGYTNIYTIVHSISKIILLSVLSVHWSSQVYKMYTLSFETNLYDFSVL